MTVLALRWTCCVQAAVFLHPGDGVCPDPAQPALCDTCHRSWLAEVYQFKSRQEPWKVWKATRVLHKKVRPDNAVKASRRHQAS